MEQLFPSSSSSQIPRISLLSSLLNRNLTISQASSSRSRKLPKNLRNPRRAKLPSDPNTSCFPLQRRRDGDAFPDSTLNESDEKSNLSESRNAEWSAEELEAIAGLFQRRMWQKPERRVRDGHFPIPSPSRMIINRVPTPKLHIRLAARETLSPRSCFSDRVFKNPAALIRISREISALRQEVDASKVLDEWRPFLRKGSLSLTIRELGHMGLPKRALETFLWLQRQQPSLFPDDRTLSSTVEILVQNRELKIVLELEKFLSSASRSVVEALVRGFIKGGSLSLARQLLAQARDSNMTLDSSLYAMLVLEAGRTPNGYKLASALIEELGDRETLDLKPHDTVSIMKVCAKLQKFEAVESLFNWFKASGGNPTAVMYTAVIHSRYCSNKYGEGLALVWEMEGLELLLDLPAYRVVIRLCVALNDLERATRYFLKLKDAGFAPTYDVYKDMIKVYAKSGRLAKCRKICREVELAGLKLDNEVLSLISGMQEQVR